MYRKKDFDKSHRYSQNKNIKRQVENIVNGMGFTNEFQENNHNSVETRGETEMKEARQHSRVAAVSLGHTAPPSDALRGHSLWNKILEEACHLIQFTALKVTSHFYTAKCFAVF